MRHKRADGRYFDALRGSSSERGYDAAWQAMRAAYLSGHPLCERCYPSITVASEVHHKQGIAEAPELRLVESNLMALCHPCHVLIESMTYRHQWNQ